MYYKLGKAYLTNWGSFVSSKIRASVVTNWNNLIITNWGKIYNKLVQVLQIRPIITN